MGGLKNALVRRLRPVGSISFVGLCPYGTRRDGGPVRKLRLQTIVPNRNPGQPA